MAGLVHPPGFTDLVISHRKCNQDANAHGGSKSPPVCPFLGRCTRVTEGPDPMGLSINSVPLFRWLLSLSILAMNSWMLGGYHGQPQMFPNYYGKPQGLDLSRPLLGCNLEIDIAIVDHNIYS